MKNGLGHKKGMELYVHIPFCAKKCNYCDFRSGVADDLTQKSYVDQLCEEIRSQGKMYCDDFYITTIFIGGGTPSILKGTWVGNIMSAIYESCSVNALAEVTIECNPGTVNVDKLRIYRQNGINRVSFGLQSADNEELRLLGRVHTFEDFLDSYQMAREVGFTNINVDLMSALPGQSVESWKETLRKVVRLKPEHISSYSLIIEEGTPFFTAYGNREGQKNLPSEEEEREMYYFTNQYLRAHGFERYEISNYAKKGFECKHNVGYWTGVPYLGLGLGASSYVYNRRFHTEENFDAYMKILMNRDITPLYQDIQELGTRQRMEEFMFLGLRLTRGVSAAEFMERFGSNMFKVFDMPIRKNVIAKLLEVQDSRLYLTEKGLDLSNRVMSDFLFD